MERDCWGHNRLREARERLGLTAKDAAAMVGVTPRTLRNWEEARTEPLLSAFLGAARAYGADADWLAGTDRQDKGRGCEGWQWS